MDLSLIEAGGGAMVVSQFTLFGDCSKGRRPSFVQAAGPEKGKLLYEYFVKQIKKHIANVETGIFGAMMNVELVNDGPVTLVLEK
jgi:D-tyrosyl-tRNA(Tyr) deacylase